MTNSIRTETRSVRPYRGVEAVQELLGRSLLLTSEDSPPLAAGTTHQIDTNDSTTLDLRIRLPFTGRELTEAVAGVVSDVDAVELVVVTRAKLFRRSHISVRIPISSDLPQVLQVTQREPARVYGDRTGGDVLLAAVLTQQLEREPLRPYLPGTWLGLSRWQIRPIREFGFSIRELTDEKRLEVSLPPASMTYVSISSDILNAADNSLADHVVQYVDGAVLSAVKSSTSAVAEQIQTLLASDLLLQLLLHLPRIVREQTGEHSCSGSSLERYPSIYEFFVRVATATGCTVESLVFYAQDDLMHLRPLLEDALGLRRASIRALGA